MSKLRRKVCLVKKSKNVLFKQKVAKKVVLELEKGKMKNAMKRMNEIGEKLQKFKYLKEIESGSKFDHSS